MVVHNNLSTQQIMDYVNIMGKHGKKTLSVLGRMQDFNAAINSPLGAQLMKHLISMHEDLLIKVASLTATDDEKSDYKAVGRLLGVWATEIATYESKLNEIIKVVNKKERKKK